MPGRQVAGVGAPLWQACSQATLPGLSPPFQHCRPRTHHAPRPFRWGASLGWSASHHHRELMPPPHPPNRPCGAERGQLKHGTPRIFQGSPKHVKEPSTSRPPRPAQALHSRLSEEKENKVFHSLFRPMKEHRSHHMPAGRRSAPQQAPRGRRPGGGSRRARGARRAAPHCDAPRGARSLLLMTQRLTHGSL
jgi:hypothetical protein